MVQVKAADGLREVEVAVVEVAVDHTEATVANLQADLVVAVMVDGLQEEAQVDRMEAAVVILQADRHQEDRHQEDLEEDTVVVAAVVAEVVVLRLLTFSYQLALEARHKVKVVMEEVAVQVAVQVAAQGAVQAAVGQAGSSGKW